MVSLLQCLGGRSQENRMCQSDLILLEKVMYLMSLQFYAQEAVSLGDSNHDVDLIYLYSTYMTVLSEAVLTAK